MRISILALLLLCTSCAASPGEIPPTETSEASILILRRQIDSIDAAINAMAKPRASANDITLRFRRSALNALFAAFASHGTEDIHLRLLPTRPVWSESTSFLGMSVRNTLDVDTGTVFVDIKKIECAAFNRNTVEMGLEIEGGGLIGVSGRYAGIPLRASLLLSLSLRDNLRFSITSAGLDNILLTPDRHTFLLKTTMSVRFMQWTIPYTRELPLEAETVIGAIVLPLSVSSTVMFPAPWAQDANRRFDFVPRTVRISHASVWAEGEVLEFRADVDFLR